MLEQLARDVTGWPAHAVEFRELLGWTQHLEHQRPQACWFDVRSLERDERVDGPFDIASHTVDVRPIGRDEGWHAIRNVGFFLWRLGSYPLLDVPARAASAWGFHFSPLGNSAPLFQHERRGGNTAGLTTELHVPGPIRRAFFAADLDAHRTTPPPDWTDLYGTIDELGAPLVANPEASLFVRLDGAPVPPAQIVCMRLDPWPAAAPSGAIVGIDVVSGRLAVGDGFGTVQAVDVEFHYGFPADIGGGPYARRNWLIAQSPVVTRYPVQASATDPSVFTTVTDALARWNADGRPDAVVAIRDSRTYELPASLTLADATALALEAASGQRPLLQPEGGVLTVDADGTDPDPAKRGRLTLSGVVVEGSVHVTGDAGALRVIHATLVPGRSIVDGAGPVSESSVAVEGDKGGATINAGLRLELASAITGPISIPAAALGVWILDSIVDGLGGAALSGAGTDPSARATIERSTLLGTVTVHALDASESIFTGSVQSARSQAGCVRFSFVPRGSRTPRRYECQPDLATRAALEAALAADPALDAAAQEAIRAAIAAWLVPAFDATEYGQPAYCRLRLTAPAELRTGASDGAEMGVYCQVKQPQRESNLRIRLDEYLPFGLDAGFIYVT